MSYNKKIETVIVKYKNISLTLFRFPYFFRASKALIGDRGTGSVTSFATFDTLYSTLYYFAIPNFFRHISFMSILPSLILYEIISILYPYFYSFKKLH
jgi:hypothetical protein